MIRSPPLSPGQKPSDYLVSMTSWIPDQSNRDSFFTRLLFIDRMPESMKSMLISKDDLSLQELSLFADSIVAAEKKHPVCLTYPPEVSDLETSVDKVQLTNKPRAHRPQPQSSASNARICPYHTKWGNKAIKCTPPCSFAASKQNVNGVHSSGVQLPEVRDAETDVAYILDTGSSISILPVAFADHQRRAPDVTPEAISVEGRPLKSFGYRFHNFSLEGMKFTHRFLLADVDSPLLGYDFIVKNNFSVHPTAPFLRVSTPAPSI